MERCRALAISLIVLSCFVPTLGTHAMEIELLLLWE